MPVPYDLRVADGSLSELWTDDGPVPAAMGREYLAADDIKELLRQGPVQFIVVNSGSKLDWKDRDDCFRFWKKEVKKHLYTDAMPCREDYPDEWCYTADEWILDTGEIVVVLYVHH
jgi:hypothetical protein